MKISFPTHSKGFTLIELLVVIAIIAILTGVVLVNLTQARGKGVNGGIRSSLAQLRTESNLYFNDYGNYGTAAAVGSCSTPNTIFVASSKFSQIIANIQSSSGNTPVCRNTTGSNGGWVISVQAKVPEGANNYICADHRGVLKGHVSALTAGVVCP